MSTKLNIGCGQDYRDGWINLDQNREVKADTYCDVNDGLPFLASTFDYVLMDNSLEHVGVGCGIIAFMEEIWRVCKPGATVEIFVPHCSSPTAFKHLTHYHFFGIGSFGIFTPEIPRGGERYGQARFEVISEELLLLTHGSQNFGPLYPLTRPLNSVVNRFGVHWKLILEKFLPGGFEEMRFVLRVVK